MFHLNLSLKAILPLLALSGLSKCESPSSRAPQIHRKTNLLILPTVPTRFGYVLFPGFEALDMFGSIDALNHLQELHYMNLTLIAATLDPVYTNRLPWYTTSANSTFGEAVLPTHTFATAPPLDVLVIPGGNGLRAPAPILNSAIDFVRDRYPTLQYLLTVCNGAGLAARAGVLDGKSATTNKLAWVETVALGPKVNWIAHARWVTDGNIWTSAGVSAGIDLMIAFIGHVWGQDLAQKLAIGMEYTAAKDSSDDPFAALYNLTDVPAHY
ncbi:Class I glutamine amidotransferase-like protein [Venustampulla echinocandica]|uniref:Class I glutamine amidotransferase-like protein n=1 Tax=Venustampulla echinocandica TaxID=2656787 RepID=A0A370TAF4_9HELO|nr:Class I glutamine amidotransferase-like protein [Venustampulla echinocandica]RDL30786.1 Class I glutamine amidotransferase-like protein [Venustampulla echinocandica]